MTFRSEDRINLQHGTHNKLEFEILAVLEFNSDRKRQSVIYRKQPCFNEELIYDDLQPIYIATKGADN